MKVSLKGYRGKVKKNATVISNDPQTPRLTLALQGTVKTLIDIRPNDNISFRGMSDQISESTIDIASDVQPFHILKTESNLEEQIGYKLETVEDGKHYQLKVSNKLKEGSYSGYIKCSTDLEQKSDFLIRVSGYIEGEIAVKPKTVLVGNLAAQQPTRMGKIIVMSNSNKPFKISKLTYDQRMIEVTQQPIDKQNGFILEINPKMENVPAGSQQRTSLSVETDAAPGDVQEVQIHLINAAQTPPAEGNASGSSQPANPDDPGRVPK